jgi:hypothetical protein
MRKALQLFLLAAMTAFAADVTGAWKGSLETPMGTMELRINIKAEGAVLTGTMKFMENDLKIEKGKLDGNKVSFEINPEFGTMAYSGTVTGDEMKLNLTVMDSQVPVVMTRVKP